MTSEEILKDTIDKILSAAIARSRNNKHEAAITILKGATSTLEILVEIIMTRDEILAIVENAHKYIKFNTNYNIDEKNIMMLILIYVKTMLKLKTNEEIKALLPNMAGQLE